jgi:hypothetical protein
LLFDRALISHIVCAPSRPELFLNFSQGGHFLGGGGGTKIDDRSTRKGTFGALLEVFTAKGLPASLYTDRGSHYSRSRTADPETLRMVDGR